jgi:hypothetical protein
MHKTQTRQIVKFKIVLQIDKSKKMLSVTITYEKDYWVTWVIIVFYRSCNKCYIFNYTNDIFDMLLDLTYNKYYEDYVCIIKNLFDC